MYCFEVFLQDLSESEVTGLELKDLLIFITGEDKVPPLGFDHLISIEFYDSDKILPWTSTCILSLNFPRQIEHPTDFKRIMVQSLLECQGI